MRSLCVISDTHGRLDNIRKILPEINECEKLVFLGDCTGDVYRLRQEITTETVCVSGNCDFYGAYPDEVVFEWCGHKFFATHGNKYRVKSDLLDITYAAKERNCDVVLFGHTHEAVVEESNGIRLINPGSLSEPRFGKSSYCIIIEEQGNIFAKIIFTEA